MNSKSLGSMNKPMIMAIAALAVVVSMGATTVPQAFAQLYGGGGGTATPAQLEECDSLGIERSICNDTTILAKKRLTAANANPQTGSGTPYFDPTRPEGTWVMLGALGAIFGGVAAAFFFRGRGSKPVTT